MANLYNVPLKNAVQFALQNALLSSETGTITFTTTVSSILQASSTMKGILVIDRVDTSGNLTPSKVEYISFTGVTGSTVTTLTRGLAGSTTQDHNAGAIVELIPDITWAQAINDVITNQHNSDGTHKTLSNISLVSITLNNSMAFGMSSASATLTNTTLFSPSLASASFSGRTYIPVSQRFISTGTTTLDWSVSNIHTISLSAATTTLAFSNPVAGQSLITRLGQDGTGSRNVVFPSTINWAGGFTPILTSTASKTDVFGFLCTASGYYDGYTVGQNI